MEYLYEGIEEIFRNTNNSHNSSRYLIYSEIAISIIILSQQIRLLWYPTAQIQEWNKYENFWNAINFLSVDTFASNFGLINEVVIFVFCMILIASILFFMIMWLKYFQRGISSVVIYILKILFVSISEVYFISFINILLAIFKYSLSYYSITQEYSSSIQTSFNWGTAGISTSIVSLFILMFLTTIYNTGSCDIRQPLENNITTAKSSVKINQILTIVYFINSFLYFFIGYNNYEAYLLILLAFYSYISVYYMYYLPYYSYYLNIIKIFFQLESALAALVFWLGLRLNDAGIPFLLTVVGQPFLLLLTVFSLRYRISKIEINSELYFNNFENYELSIRSFLKSGELERNLIRKMNKNFKITKNALNRIILAYYCNDVLQNYKLAYNKIIGVKYNGLNIFLNYQIYKCRKIMTSHCKMSSEGYKIIQYFNDIEKIKFKDRKFCEDYFNLAEKILDPKSSLSSLKNKINKLSKEQKSLIHYYTIILETFPYSREANDMYGSFLSDILYDIKKGKIYSSRISKNKKRFNTIQNSDKINNRAIVVFSGNSASIGKILYANKDFVNFIGLSMDLLKTNSFFNFLPHLISKRFNELLLDFVENCTDIVLFKNLPLFLIDYQGYLCECFISIELIGGNESINFVCSIDLINSMKREIAAVDLNGVIYAHSKNFLKILGYNQNCVENMNIQYYFPEIIISELIIDTVYKVKSQQENKIIDIMLKTCKIQDTIIYTLFITDDINEGKLWKNLENFYIIENSEEIEEISVEAISTEKNKEISYQQQGKILRIESIKQEIQKIDEKNMKTIKKKINNKFDIKQSESYSNSTTELDKNESRAVNKSTQVLKISKIILFVSVNL